MNFLKILKNLVKTRLKKGFKIGYSSGKSFDPRNQKRTDPIDDIMKKT